MKESIEMQGLDISAIRRRLAEADGKLTWQSLDELTDSDAFRSYLDKEFPEGATEWQDGVGRRQFLQLMGASLAFAGLVSCTNQPTEKIVPFTRQPENMIPGKPQFYASAHTHRGYANGILVESHMGRPTKVEGNAQHPTSLGATDVFAQASVLSLYDPDRSQIVLQSGAISTWSRFLSEFDVALSAQKVKQGAGLRVLTETVTSPTLARQIAGVKETYPEARWHHFDPTARDNARQGAVMAFGEPVQARYRLDRARVILSLDADFLTEGPDALRLAREFASGRKAEGGRAEMNRLYAVESTPSNTGSMADHRIGLRARDIEGFGRAVARAAGVEAGQGDPRGHDAWVAALAKDLQANRGACAVVVGDHQPPELHALGHALNASLGNVGKTVVYTDPVEVDATDHVASLKALLADIDAGQVDLLVILGGNPVYNAPADLFVAESLGKVGTRIHLSPYVDETSQICHWHLPQAHDLEAWGDARAADGTVSIVQPLIEPLYDGKSSAELMSCLLGKSGRSGYDIVRETWQERHPEDFEPFWRGCLHDGLVPETALPDREVTLKADAALQASRSPEDLGLEVIFRPDPCVGDGRYSNNGWLQELPKPHTRLTWENAALLAPATAEALGVGNEDVVSIQLDGRSVEAPVWILPGHAAGSITLHLGYGRTHAGRVGDGAGFDAYRLQASGALWFASGAEVSATGRSHRLGCTQDHQRMEGRPLVRVGTVDEYQSNPHFAQEMEHVSEPEMTLYHPEEHKRDGYAWGMAIDLNACTGCNACTIACQSENNIPVVGKEQVLNGREMHWIRVDRYFKGDLDSPETYNQPVPCMHCENAPCEPVCPVAATVHSDEGLNDMVYNRCVGTRYCSNNCPYKVRRFNFLQYSDEETPVLKLLRNPDVTVRSRGVMEKCTYCVQRINTARIESKKEDRGINDGEVVTACQGACPTQAITFGNINDPNSKVSRMKADERNYGLLTQLGIRPRTTYLARLRNPNPEIAHG